MTPPHLKPAMPPDRPWRRLLVSTVLVMACASTALLAPTNEQPATPAVQAVSVPTLPAI